VKRLWTIVGVRNVRTSLAWYQALLGLGPSEPAHDYFGQLVDEDGLVLLCLHSWGEHDHPSLTSAERAEPGNGLLLFFRVDDFERALATARTLSDRLEEEPHRNPNTTTLEFSLRDPDGYFVTVSALPDA
jgi:catechol 2,3-dioxygenase-like lactoylglutathione lyase family enzyme